MAQPRGTGEAVAAAEFTVTCPYCGEDVAIYIESDVRGTLIQDRDVCCNPWQLRVTRDGDERWDGGREGGWVGVGSRQRDERSVRLQADRGPLQAAHPRVLHSDVRPTGARPA